MIRFKFLPRFSIQIILTFIFFTAIGTILHEFGHQSIATYFGYDTKLSYGSISYFHPGKNTDSLYIEYMDIWKENFEKIKEKTPFEKEGRFFDLAEILKKKYPYSKTHSIWIAAGGPMQTILTSLLGLLILFRRRSKNKENFFLLDWLGVFLALFSLREIFNFVLSLYFKIFYENRVLGNDEFKISRLLGLNEWVIPTMAMILALFICCYVIFIVIPKRYRFTFIISGLVGGVLGFFVWLKWLGPILLP